MDFSALKQSNDSFLAGMQTRVENKQRLSLSEHAVSTLIGDLEIFQPNPSLINPREIISSASINRIFAHFRSEARSAVAQSLENERIRLQSIIQNCSDEQSRDLIINALLHDYRLRLIREREQRCKQKNCEIYFRINKENIEYLISVEGQAEGVAYNDKIGLFFKAVLEEYCEQTYVVRERIYYQDFVDEIQLAIDYRKLLKVTLKSKSKRTGFEKNNIMYVKPLCITQDSEQFYNYLVGMTSISREGPWQIGSIRLTSILKCEHQMHPMTISSSLQTEIENEIKRKGIQFLSDHYPAQKILVKLTPRGMRMYQSMLHLRPQYQAKTIDGILEFNCSVHQIKNYFFKFGEDALILEPTELANWFTDKYQRAVNRYSAE